jgi:hypothetical protein
VIAEEEIVKVVVGATAVLVLLFLYGLFKDVFSVSRCATSNDGKNNEE